MRKEERLNRSSQITAVLKDGKAWGNDFFVLKAMPNGLEFNRFCFIVSKKVEKRAVARNKVKRLLREVMRLTPIEAGWDIVVIARKGVVGVPYRDIESAMIGLLNRANLLGRG